MAGSDAGLRRSGRKRTRTTKYTDDVLAELDVPDALGDIEQQQIEPESPNETEIIGENLDPGSDHSDDDVASPATAVESDEDESEELEDDEEYLASGRRRKKPAISKLARRRTTVPKALADEDLYSRRLKPLPHGTRRAMLILDTLGDCEQDHISVIKTTEKWPGPDAFPARVSDEQDVGGFAETFFLSDAEKESRAKTEWEWYYENGGKLAFGRNTSSRSIKPNTALPYLADLKSSCSLLWGPAAHQTLYNLAVHKSINIHGEWTEGRNTNGNETSRDASVARIPGHGWCINIGEPVHLLGWIPNKAESIQYLSLATWPKAAAAEISAFTPLGESPSSVQIWELRGSEVTPGSYTIDEHKAPSLSLVLCFDWGLVKDMQWCPVPRAPRSETEKKSASLGLLALITGDGKIRVLDVELPSGRQDSKSRYYSSASFEICPPDTVCTCVAWISSKLIAAGCANGYVAIFDISSQLLRTGPGESPFPIFYQSLHMNYVRHISSCQPSRPHLLITSAMEGITRLTDIRSPNVDTVSTTRSRTSFPAIAWHDQVQHLLSAEDPAVLKGSNVRAFFRFTVLANLDASPLSLATSPVHPYILIGLADGSVTALNPVVRLVSPKRQAETYVQKWFKHEMRRGKSVHQPSATADSPLQAPTAQSENQPASSAPLDFPNGLVRITAGYAPQLPPLTRGAAVGSRQGNSDGRQFSTLYEEQTGVRCVTWNPNLSCGGWAAAGMMSGLVFVEDLAVD